MTSPHKMSLLLLLLLLITTAATSLVLLPHHWSLYWTIAANGFQLFFLAVSLDATVYFGAHGTNFNVTTGGARDDYITETHHWSMEETTNWRSRMEWTE